MSDLKVSQLPAKPAIDGTELLYVVSDGQQFRATVSDVVASVASGETTKASLGLDNVDNTSDINKPISAAQASALAGKADSVHIHTVAGVAGLQTLLDAKASSSDVANALILKANVADLASKAEVVHVHAITEVTGLQAALDSKPSTAAVQTMIEGVVGASPDALNTIQEIATALQNDPNVVTTIQNGLALKANIADVNIALGLKADASDVATGLATKADTVHNHAVSDITGLQTELDSKVTQSTFIDGLALKADITTLASKADTTHQHLISEVTGLQVALDDKADNIATTTALAGKADISMLTAKADISHSHSISDVTGLQDALDNSVTQTELTTGLNGKANSAHDHSYADINNLNELYDQIRLALSPAFIVGTGEFAHDGGVVNINFDTTYGYSMSTVTMIPRYKKSTDTEYTVLATIPFVNGTLNYNFNLSGLDAETTYNIIVELSDTNNPVLTASAATNVMTAMLP